MANVDKKKYRKWLCFLATYNVFGQLFNQPALSRRSWPKLLQNVAEMGRREGNRSRISWFHILFLWFLQIVRIILFALEHWFRNFVEEKHPFSSREICCLITTLQCLIQCLFDGVCSHECLFSYVCWCCYIVASWRICVNERVNACLSLLTPTLLSVCSAPLQRLLASCWQCLLAMVKAICCGSLLSAHLYFLLHPPFFSFFLLISHLLLICY